MSLVQVRQEIDEKLDMLDADMLKAIHTILFGTTSLIKEENAEIVGYEVDGTAISLKNFAEKAAKELKEVRNGNYTSLEDHKKETEEWLTRTK